MSIANAQNWSRTEARESVVPRWALVVASVAIFGTAYVPLLVEFFDGLWRRPHYQFFPFVLAAFGWLFWRRLSRAVPREANYVHERSALVVLLWGAAWAILALGIVAGSPWLTLFSAILLVAGLIARVSARWQVTYLWGIWALLWLIVPIPLNQDQPLVTALQLGSSRLSSFVLDWVGVPHLMDGNTLLLADRQFFVDEACSGIVSLMSVIACAVIYGVWQNRSPLHVVLLALCGMGWATLLNVVRISAIAIAHARAGVDWSTGAAHEVLGLVIFAIVFGALVSTDYLLLGLLAPISERYESTHGKLPNFGRSLVAWWDRICTLGAPQPAEMNEMDETMTQPGPSVWHSFAFGIVPLAAFGLLAALQLTEPLWGATDVRMDVNIERALAIEANDLPPQLDEVTRASFKEEERTRDDVFGHYSRLFEYQDGRENSYLVSCDFPFGPDWHELTSCYRGTGWELTDRRVVPDPHAASSGEARWDYVEAHFKRRDGTVALLLYCVFDAAGDAINPPSDSIWDVLLQMLKKRSSRHDERTLYQFQVLTSAPETIHPAQRQAAEKLILSARERMRKTITGPAATAQPQVPPADVAEKRSVPVFAEPKPETDPGKVGHSPD
jgi:exosortase